MLHYRWLGLAIKAQQIKGNERLFKSRTCCTTLTVSAGCPTTIPAEPPSQPATKSHHQFDDIFSLCLHLIGQLLSLKKDTTDTKLPQQLPQSLAVLYPSLQPLGHHMTCLCVCVCLCLCLCNCCFVAVFARLCWFRSNPPLFSPSAAMCLVFLFVFVFVFLFYSVCVFSWLCSAQSGPPLQPLGRHVTLSLGSRLVRCKQQFFTPARSIPKCFDVIRMLTSLQSQLYALECVNMVNILSGKS